MDIKYAKSPFAHLGKKMTKFSFREEDSMDIPEEIISQKLSEIKTLFENGIITKDTAKAMFTGATFPEPTAQDLIDEIENAGSGSLHEQTFYEKTRQELQQTLGYSAKYVYGLDEIIDVINQRLENALAQPFVDKKSRVVKYIEAFLKIALEAKKNVNISQDIFLAGRTRTLRGEAPYNILSPIIYKDEHGEQCAKEEAKKAKTMAQRTMRKLGNELNKRVMGKAAPPPSKRKIILED